MSLIYIRRISNLIISDELVDYFAEMDNAKAEMIAEQLYDKTMEYYEINS